MSIDDLLRHGLDKLRAAGIAEPHSDVYLLLGHVLGKSRTKLMVDGGQQVGLAQQEHYERLLRQRCRRKPLAYILGEQEFWSLPFFVNSSVLIPRPETEFVLDYVLRHVQHQSPFPGTVVDLCCGSGVMAVVLARELGCRVVAVDISRDALIVARRNAVRHEVAAQVTLLQADLLQPFADDVRSPLIVANPPYVTSRSLATELEPEVAVHEPKLALDGGSDGLALIRRIRRMAPAVLAPGGQLFMEIGYDQGLAVQALFAEPEENVPAFTSVEVVADYAGRDRLLHAVMAQREE